MDKHCLFADINALLNRVNSITFVGLSILQVVSDAGDAMII